MSASAGVKKGRIAAMLAASALAGSASAEWEGFAAGGEAARKEKEALLKSPSPQSVQSLASALSSAQTGDGIRFWAAQTLSEIAMRLPGQQELIKKALALAQSDRNAEVQFAAALGLARLCDGRGEKALVSRLGGADTLRQIQALEALRRVGGREAVPALIEILPHPDREVRARAFWTLAAITGQSIGKRTLLSEGFPDFAAIPAYQERRQTLAQLKSQIAMGSINKDELGLQAARVESEIRKLIADEIGRARTQFLLDAQEIALQWKQWLAEHREEGPLSWLFSGVSSPDPEIAPLVLERLRSTADASAVAKLLAFCDDAKTQGAVRLKAIATAGALLDAKQVPDWLDRLERASKAAGGAAEAADARLEAYRTAEAFAAGLRGRSGASFPPEPELWRAWWKRASALEGFDFGSTFFAPGADPGVEFAIVLPRNPAAEPVDLKVGRWDPKAGRWEAAKAQVRSGEPVGAGALATGLKLKRVSAAEGDRGFLWELEAAGGRLRPFHAR